MAKTKVGELAATLKMDGAQLVEQINKFDLGFTVKTPTSQLTEDQVKEIEAHLDAFQGLGTACAHGQCHGRLQ